MSYVLKFQVEFHFWGSPFNEKFCKNYQKAMATLKAAGAWNIVFLGTE